MPTITLPFSGVSKRSLIDGALEEWGIQSRTPEEVARGLRRLNALMAEPPFNALPFNRPNYGVGEPDELSGVEPIYEQAVSLSLAKRYAPTEGAQLAPASEAALARSMASLRADLAAVPTMKLGAFAAGAGNRGRPTFIVDA